MFRKMDFISVKDIQGIYILLSVNPGLNRTEHQSEI